MKSEELFSKCDDLISKIVSVLKHQEKLFTLKSGGIQRVSDLRQGFIRRGGLLIPLTSIEYRFLFDHYESAFLSSFIIFYEKLFLSKEELFTEFAIRTIFDMGVYQAPILFSKKLDKNLRNKYKLLCMLCDYGFLSFNNNTYLIFFRKLLRDYSSLLGKGERGIFESLDKSVTDSDNKGFTKNVVRARKLIQNERANLYSKVELLPGVFDDTVKNQAVYSSFSHLNHGNILILDNLFSDKRQLYQHILRVYTFLLITGLNVLNYVSNYLDGENSIKEQVEHINDENNQLKIEINNFWIGLDRKFK